MQPFRATLVVMLAAGCTARGTYPARAYLGTEIHQRIAHTIPPDCSPIGDAIPEGVSLEDGVDEDETVALALWSNAAFLEALAELGITRADLVQAGLLSNPVLSVLFPLGPKQLEFTATFPLEALWLRPRRVQIAELDAERVANRLVQTGLDLARDVRWAYTELRRATDRVRLAEQGVNLMEQIAKVAEARVRAGEASELERSMASIEVLRAKEELARFTQDVTLAHERLRSLVGREFLVKTAALNQPRQLTDLGIELESLVANALAARPDLRAAELTTEAACHRAELAKIDYLTIAGLLDANGEGTKGFEAGPGLLVTLPIFHQNDGAVARAIADIERSVRQYHTVADRIQLEVREAHTRYEQARQQLETWRAQILPVAEQTVSLAQKAFEEGDTSYLFVLETIRHLLDARVHEVESEASLRRAWAELDRSVGQRLDSPQRTTPSEVLPCNIVWP